MFKKIISLMLVACMVLALGVTVSAEEQGTLYLKVTKNSATNLFVDVAIKNNTVVVDADEDGQIGDAEKGGITAYQLIMEYDKDKFTLANIMAIGKGTAGVGFTNNKATDTTVWASAGGVYEAVTDPVTYMDVITGLAETDFVRYIFNVKMAAITEEDYGKEFEFKFASKSNATGAEVDFTPVTFEIEDIRAHITGLVATAKAVEYTGEVIDPASTIEVNSIEGDVVKVTADREIKDAGTYTVTAEVSRTGFKKTTASTEVVVAPKAITATVANATKVYGEADPAFTATAEGLVAGDELAYTFTRAEGEDAGKYAINATATNANYTVDVTAGELEITPKAITATVANATKVYGEADPAFTATATGLVGEDTLTYTYERAEGENVGKYAINATATNANYTVDVTAGELEITKKAATIKVQDEFQVLGNDKLTTFKAPVFEGLVGNDTIEITGYEVADWADVEGDYALTVTYVANDNYNITVVPGKYSVKSAIPVVITFGENKKTYGDADGEIVVSGDVELVTIVRKEAEAAGTYTDAYEVTLKATEDPSGLPYALTVENNVFVIEPKAATITVANAEKKYGAADPAFTFTAEGFLEGEAPAEVAFSRVEGETAGEYAITAAYADPNYAITVVDGKLAISKYALTITAPTVKVNLNKEVPALEAVVEGAVDEDVIVATVAVYNGEEVVAEVDTSVEAEYTTKATSDANTDKYDVTYVDGTLTVKKASGRPSGGGSVVKPATKPEDKEDVKDDETDKPVASANIALKENAKEIKFIEGFEDKTFRPDDNATRNDVVSALTALFDVTDVKNAPAFNDTDDAAIKALAAAGVINGYEDGSFKGYNDVTRAEFVKLVAAALKLEAVEGAEANFSDIEGHWAAEWIKTFVGKGYLVGYPDGTFRPEDKITRAEMVVVITRVVGTVDAEAAVNFADVNDAHWAYKYIMNAAK